MSTPAFQRIEQRNLALWIVFTIITLGLYPWFWVSALARDVNIMCKGDGKNTAGFLALFFLTPLTLGIYFLVWVYNLGDRLHDNARRRNLNAPESGSTLLLWWILGSMLCGVGPVVAIHIIIKNTNALAADYNQRASE